MAAGTTARACIEHARPAVRPTTRSAARRAGARRRLRRGRLHAERVQTGTSSQASARNKPAASIQSSLRQHARADHARTAARPARAARGRRRRPSRSRPSFRPRSSGRCSGAVPEDEAPATGIDPRGDRGDRDQRHRRDADAAEDRGQREGSTRNSFCSGVNPKPSAASRAAGGRQQTGSDVARKIICAYATSGRRGRRAEPSTTTRIAKSARLGIVQIAEHGEHKRARADGGPPRRRAAKQ